MGASTMTWYDKSTEIAANLASKRLSCLKGSEHWERIIDALREAALEGIRYECDSWVLKRV